MKQVMVVNNSLKLPKGKLAAQVAHASVAAFIAADEKAKKAWIKIGMPKVVVKGDSEDLLIKLMTRAEAQGIPVCLIEDAGKTVVPEGTITCLGLGPASEANLDELTGELKLL
jgi:peptidyl-tRNA hydrolase